MKLRSWQLKQLQPTQRYLLRLDLNVPIQGGKIKNDYKLRIALKTIRLFYKVPLIIITHLGEPVAGKDYHYQAAYSVAPLAKYLQQRLKRKVHRATGSWTNIIKQSKSLQAGEILFLENIRFWPGETKNDLVLAKQLAQVGDVYINDAFAVSHRAHASVAAITRYLPAYAGPCLLEEVKALNTVFKRKKITLVVGGKKISTKLPVIKHLLPRCHQILIGGAMANTFIRAQGHEIGLSVYEPHELNLARRLISKKIMIPVDVTIYQQRKYINQTIEKITKNDKIVDIGRETAQIYGKIIATSSTIIWNGPVGIIENKKAGLGTKKIISALDVATKAGAFSIIGGGETLEAFELLGKNKKVSWVSTGGGATLTFLSNKPLPGLQGLEV